MNKNNLDIIDIKNIVIDIISNICERTIKPSMKFADLGLNSISFIKLIVEVETMLCIEFDEAKLNYDSFVEVEDFVNYVLKLCNKV